MDWSGAPGMGRGFRDVHGGMDSSDRVVRGGLLSSSPRALLPHLKESDPGCDMSGVGGDIGGVLGANAASLTSATPPPVACAGPGQDVASYWLTHTPSAWQHAYVVIVVLGV